MQTKVAILCAVAFLFCCASVYFNEKRERNDRASNITLLIAYVLLFAVIGIEIERITGGF